MSGLMPVSRDTGRAGKVTGVGTGQSTIVFTGLSKATTQGGGNLIGEVGNSIGGLSHRKTSFGDDGDSCFEITTPEGDPKNDLALNLDMICENVTAENESSTKFCNSVLKEGGGLVKKSGFVSKIDVKKDYHKNMMTFDQIDEQEELDCRCYADASPGSKESKGTGDETIGSEIFRSEKTGNSDYSRAETSSFSRKRKPNRLRSQTSSQNSQNSKNSHKDKSGFSKKDTGKNFVAHSNSIASKSDSKTSAGHPISEDPQPAISHGSESGEYPAKKNYTPSKFSKTDTVFNPLTTLKGSSIDTPINQKPSIARTDTIFNPKSKNIVINNYSRLDSCFNPPTSDTTGINGLSRENTLLHGNQDSRVSANFGILPSESPEPIEFADPANNEEKTETKTTKESSSIKTEKTCGRTIQEETKTSTTTTIVKGTNETYKLKTITIEKKEIDISAESERKLTRKNTFGGDELGDSWETAGFKSQEEKGGRLGSLDSPAIHPVKFVAGGIKDNITFCPDNRSSSHHQGMEDSLSFVDRSGIPSMNSWDQACLDLKSPEGRSGKRGSKKKSTFEAGDRLRALQGSENSEASHKWGTKSEKNSSKNLQSTRQKRKPSTVKIPTLSPTLDLHIPLRAVAKRPNKLFEELGPMTDHQGTESKSKKGDRSKTAIKSKHVILNTSDIDDELAGMDDLVMEFDINHTQRVSVNKILSANALKREISTKEVPVITRRDRGPSGLVQMQGPKDVRASKRNILTAQEKSISTPTDQANSLPSEDEFPNGSPKNFLELGKIDVVPISSASISRRIPDMDRGYSAAIIYSQASDDDPFRESDPVHGNDTLRPQLGISELDLESNAHQKAASLMMFSDEDLPKDEISGNNTNIHKRNRKFIESTHIWTPSPGLNGSLSKADSPFGIDFGSEHKIRNESTFSKPGENDPNRSQIKQSQIRIRKSPMHVPKLQNSNRNLQFLKTKLDGFDPKPIIFKKRNSKRGWADQQSILPERRSGFGQGNSLQSRVHKSISRPHQSIGRVNLYNQKMPNIIPPDTPPPATSDYENP